MTHKTIARYVSTYAPRACLFFVQLWPLDAQKGAYFLGTVITRLAITKPKTPSLMRVEFVATANAMQATNKYRLVMP